ncbi:hypothetical protein GCM10011409_02800 [Lentibacillus populi]|uniref:Uncharacterized protein n=1 Tax=Lentibacillus populi TaxID=1827502 RepID=A0A9W5TU70_9BACI|nr:MULTISPECIES: hypothetical protein [Bacillaceae]MBT2214518.1 hypothetical protein [Virgibacillus dakarensis]GGB28953.1 hypothetical protein GCM10011409_02800 [Lentibacillus populi]
MVRSFITLLLLAVFFLSGMLLGIDRGQNTDIVQDEEEIKDVVITDANDSAENIQVVHETGMDMEDAPVHFTQKMASFLGEVIKGFYETVVMIFYQIAQIFFH